MNSHYKILIFAGFLTACSPAPSQQKETQDPAKELPGEDSVGIRKKDKLAEDSLPDDAKNRIPEPPPPKPVKDRPVLQFEQTVLSFDTLSEGEERELVFRFQNTGKAKLEITGTEATCGCTYPSFPFVPIAPGESGEIRVSFNSSGKMGRQRPMITVHSNAGNQKLFLEGFVRYPEK